jgi:Uma2 family endonuclease
MRLPNVKRTPEADLLIFLNEHLDRVRHTFVEGAADIVVEIVSPESVDRDYVKKMAEYARGGVPEYWLVDPVKNKAAVYVLGADGQYQPNALDSEGRLQSRVLPGFVLPPLLLWQHPPLEGEELLALVRNMIDV